VDAQLVSLRCLRNCPSGDEGRDLATRPEPLRSQQILHDWLSTLRHRPSQVGLWYSDFSESLGPFYRTGETPIGMAALRLRTITLPEAPSRDDAAAAETQQLGVANVSGDHT